MTTIQKLEKGFIKADSTNLPKVDIFMMAEYLSQLKNNSTDIKNQLRNRAPEKCCNDDAIGFVQLERVGCVCTMQCVVTPHHEECHSCTLVFDEEVNEIKSGTCSSCHNIGGCIHTVIVIMWLHRLSEDSKNPYIKCYYEPSVISVLQGRTFITAKELAESESELESAEIENDSDSEIKSEPESEADPGLHSEIELKFEPEEQSQSGCQPDSEMEPENDLKPNINSDSNRVFEEFKEIIDKRNKINRDIERISIHQLICKFCSTSPDLEFESFLRFCNKEVTNERCKMVQERTRTKNRLWHEMRYGRVTASRVYEAAHSEEESRNDLAEYYILASHELDKEPPKRKALSRVVSTELACHLGIALEKPGLIVNENLLFACTSPDALTEKHVIEIKYPEDSMEYHAFYKGDQIADKFYGQIQAQMHITGKLSGLLCIVHDDFEETQAIDIHDIPYNKKYCEKLFVKLIEFWRVAIFNDLIPKYRDIGKGK